MSISDLLILLQCTCNNWALMREKSVIEISLFLFGSMGFKIFTTECSTKPIVTAQSYQSTEVDLWVKLRQVDHYIETDGLCNRRLEYLSLLCEFSLVKFFFCFCIVLFVIWCDVSEIFNLTSSSVCLWSLHASTCGNLAFLQHVRSIAESYNSLTIN